jgi:hypothetical protein
MRIGARALSKRRRSQTIVVMRALLLSISFTTAGHALAAPTVCPHLEVNTGPDPIPMTLAGASFYGVFDGKLFAFDTTGACAGCQSSATGQFYDPCTNTWHKADVSLGTGWRQGGVWRLDDRVVALSTAVRRNPRLSPAEDYELLHSDTRGVVFDLESRRMHAIRRHEREWTSGEDIIDGEAEAHGRFVVFRQKPRGNRPRLFVFDVQRRGWIAHVRASAELGMLRFAQGNELWFELHDGKRSYWVFDTATSRSRIGGAVPAGGPPPRKGPGFDIAHHKGIGHGGVRLPFERGGRRFELRIDVETIMGPDGCEGVERPCDPVVHRRGTRLKGFIHRKDRSP